MKDAITNIWSERKSYLLILIQLIGIALVVKAFNIEMHVGLPRLIPILFGLFVVHSLTPIAYRLQVFVGGFIVGVLLFFPGVNGLKLLLYSFLIIGLCILPISLMVRKLLVFDISVCFCLNIVVST